MTQIMQRFVVRELFPLSLINKNLYTALPESAYG